MRLRITSSWLLTLLNMNPYSPPTSSLQHASQPPRVALRNPAWFLLYPLAAFCVFAFFGFGSQIKRNVFEFSTQDFINAVVVFLYGLFGFSAILLAGLPLSKNTRRFTIFWSIAACTVISIMFPAMFSSFQRFIFFLIPLAVGLLSFRSMPHEPNLFSSQLTSTKEQE